MSVPNTKTAFKPSLLQFLRRIHFYIGLFVAPFIFVAALSGTLYILSPQLENYLYTDALTVQQQGTSRALSEQIDAARTYAGPESRIYAIRPAPGPTETTRVQFSDPTLGESESRGVFVDPYTLDIKGDMTVYGTSGVLPLRMWIDKFHRNLLLGDLGRNYSELAASWLWIAALGGLLLWAGTRSRRGPPTAANRFMNTRRWHTTVGLVLFLGLLFVSVTGLTWSKWAGGNINSLRADLGWLTPQVNTTLSHHAEQMSHAANGDPHAGHGAAAPGMTTVSADWQRALSSARQAGILAEKVEIRAPKAVGKAWTVTEVDRRWPTRVDAVAIDPQDFSVVDRTRFEAFPLAAKLTRWGVDAHMGILFGLPNQLILIAFGVGLCFMIGLGYRMWWIRKPVASAESPVRTLVAAWLALAFWGRIISVIVAVALSIALPVMGVSLSAFLVVDLVRWKRGQRSAALALSST
ncbi:membrane protein [Advenella kashmirensis W13003]|uniref:Membrane protein n=1 Tax=Advenella kashmirensis W13003 TaxID=1424334 RepID=V8QWN4_9BURK|nr:PepSY-associated TM helix domain-containing protein [Advenella kashmirensis]ETF03768.1 membrane protein [Advenella kashmirensis W13003]